MKKEQLVLTCKKPTAFLKFGEQRAPEIASNFWALLIQLFIYLIYKLFFILLRCIVTQAQELSEILFKHFI